MKIVMLHPEASPRERLVMVAQKAAMLSLQHKARVFVHGPMDARTREVSRQTQRPIVSLERFSISYSQERVALAGRMARLAGFMQAALGEKQDLKYLGWVGRPVVQVQKVEGSKGRPRKQKTFSGNALIDYLLAEMERRAWILGPDGGDELVEAINEVVRSKGQIWERACKLVHQMGTDILGKDEIIEDMLSAEAGVRKHFSNKTGIKLPVQLKEEDIQGAFVGDAPRPVSRRLANLERTLEGLNEAHALWRIQSYRGRFALVEADRLYCERLEGMLKATGVKNVVWSE